MNQTRPIMLMIGLLLAPLAALPAGRQSLEN